MVVSFFSQFQWFKGLPVSFRSGKQVLLQQSSILAQSEEGHVFPVDPV